MIRKKHNITHLSTLTIKRERPRLPVQNRGCQRKSTGCSYFKNKKIVDVHKTACKMPVKISQKSYSPPKYFFWQPCWRKAWRRGIQKGRPVLSLQEGEWTSMGKTYTAAQRGRRLKRSKRARPLYSYSSLHLSTGTRTEWTHLIYLWHTIVTKTSLEYTYPMLIPYSNYLFIICIIDKCDRLLITVTNTVILNIFCMNISNTKSFCYVENRPCIRYICFSLY